MTSFQQAVSLGASFGITQKGEPCKICVRKGGFCARHEGQRAVVGYPSTASGNGGGSGSGVATRSSTRMMFAPDILTSSFPSPSLYRATAAASAAAAGGGGNSRGSSSRRTSSGGGRGVTTVVSPPVVSSSYSSTATPATTTIATTLGITKAGKTCKICIRKGDFCHFHLDQKPETPTVSPTARPPYLSSDPVVAAAGGGGNSHGNSSRRTSAGGGEGMTTVVSPPSVSSPYSSTTTTTTTIATMLGITKAGKPCKICIRKGDFCHFHLDQKPETPTARPPSLSSNPVVVTSSSPSTPFPPTAIPSAWVETLEGTKQSSVSAIDVATAAAAAAAAAKKAAKIHDILPLTTIYGITQQNEPCKLCIKRNTFCHFHTSQQQQQGRPVILLSENIKILLIKSMQLKKECKIYGITKTGKQEPCKRCIRQGLFCYQHEYQQVERQRWMTSSSSSSTTSSNSNSSSSSDGSIDLIKFINLKKKKSNVVAVSADDSKPAACGKRLDGAICKNCYWHETGFCHLHQSQKHKVLVEEANHQPRLDEVFFDANESLDSSATTITTRFASSSWMWRLTRASMMLMLFWVMIMCSTYKKDEPQMNKVVFYLPSLLPESESSNSPLNAAVAMMIPKPLRENTNHAVNVLLIDARAYLSSQLSFLVENLEEQTRHGIHYATELALDAEGKAREGVHYLSNVLLVEGQVDLFSVRTMATRKNSTFPLLGLWLSGGGGTTTEMEGTWKEFLFGSEMVLEDSDKEEQQQPQQHVIESVEQNLENVHKQNNDTNNESNLLWHYLSGAGLMSRLQARDM